MNRKVKCDEYDGCGWVGLENQLLKSVHPFDAADTLVFCPSCKSLEQLLYVCDEEGCNKTVVCGTPTQNGYRNTCGKHKPSCWKGI